jgi:hypothetical protein
MGSGGPAGTLAHVEAARKGIWRRRICRASIETNGRGKKSFLEVGRSVLLPETSYVNQAKPYRNIRKNYNNSFCNLILSIC